MMGTRSLCENFATCCDEPFQGTTIKAESPTALASALLNSTVVGFLYKCLFLSDFGLWGGQSMCDRFPLCVFLSRNVFTHCTGSVFGIIAVASQTLSRLYYLADKKNLTALFCLHISIQCDSLGAEMQFHTMTEPPL